MHIAHHGSKAKDIEMACLERNIAWILTKLSNVKTAFGSKWVYKLKTDEKGAIS
jgi:hypothetical protein